MSESDFRTEQDTLGEVKIPADKMWGPQTQRSLQNFTAGPVMPLPLIKALLHIKQAAAHVNASLGQLDAVKAAVIEASCLELLGLPDEELAQDFPLKVYQTGSGTQTNMNVNEVVAHLANQKNPALAIKPNDDVNCSQSSNDTFPTAMNISAVQAVRQLLAVVAKLDAALEQKQTEFMHVVKIGRTHLQDATPLTFGQEISGWRAMLQHDAAAIKNLLPTLANVAIGGTAVGTGLNTAPEFCERICALLSQQYDFKFNPTANKFAALAGHSELNSLHGAIKALAADVLKIANDIRFLASGPRAGYGELNIPANEPGSSIMPGKVNPTQCEAVTMAALRVFGNDTTITQASANGNFELNVYKPVLIASFLESCTLLSGTLHNFTTKLVAGLTVNQERMDELVKRSLMLVTALSPHIGYHASAKIAQTAQAQGIDLKTAALNSGKVTAEQYAEWVDPLAMTNVELSDDTPAE